MTHLLRAPFAPLSALALAAIGAALAACTTVSSVELTPGPVSVERPLDGTVRVTASGSPRRFGIGAPVISGASVATALQGAILASGLAAGVVESGSADHVLRVEILDAQRSELQLDMEAEVSARWTLFDGDGDTMRWQREITTQGEANTFDAQLVEERARMALEAALRANLEEGLTELGRAPAR